MLRLQLELHKLRTSTLQSFANKRRFVQQFASLQVKIIRYVSGISPVEIQNCVVK